MNYLSYFFLYGSAFRRRISERGYCAILIRRSLFIASQALYFSLNIYWLEEFHMTNKQSFWSIVKIRALLDPTKVMIKRKKSNKNFRKKELKDLGINLRVKKKNVSLFLSIFCSVLCYLSGNVKDCLHRVDNGLTEYTAPHF